MATKETVAAYDDLDGSKIHTYSGPVEIALDGVNYEIDLSDTNHQQLHEKMAGFVAAARKVSSGGNVRVQAGGKQASGKARVTTAKPKTATTPVAPEPEPERAPMPETTTTTTTVTPSETVPTTTTAPMVTTAPPKLTPEQNALMSRRVREWGKGRTFNVNGQVRVIKETGSVPQWAKDLWLADMAKQKAQEAPQQDTQPAPAKVPAFSG